MKSFGVVLPKEYTIQDFYASSPVSWTLQSSSLGTVITNPLDDELEGAVTINRADGDPSWFNYKIEAPINVDTGIGEHVLYASVKHLLYNYGRFFDQYSEINESPWDITQKIYVVSIGQQFFGDRIKPGSFTLNVNSDPQTVQDDGYGNLFVSQSSTGSYVGNIFYERGIAVIGEHTSSLSGSVSPEGVKIFGNDVVGVDYETNIKVTRHEVTVRLQPSDFNFAFLNPSLRNEITVTGSVADGFERLNIPSSSENSWTAQSLMQAGVLNPYITSIGLYNKDYEMVAVAKLSTPIQRTFNADQIFIVRFDV